MAKKQLRSIKVAADQDIVSARQIGRQMATELGFQRTEIALIVTAISELARNILLYACEGEVRLEGLNRPGRIGIQIVARDKGPGIEDTAAAMTFGYSTSGNLGMGLPGVKRVMDEFEIKSESGKGTRVTVTKWHNHAAPTSNAE